MVPCVFGRRERKRRPSSSGCAPRASCQQSPSESGKTIAITPTHNLCPDIAGAGIAVPKALGLHETEPFPFYDDRVTISAEQSINDEQNITMSEMELGILSHAYHDNNVMGDGELFGYNIPYPVPFQHQMHRSQQQHALPSSTSDWNLDFNDGDFSASLSAISKPKAASTILLHLAADLHERLTTLENEPSWRRENAGIVDYPIGSVLTLSNKLKRLGTALQMDDGSDDSTYGGRSRKPSNTSVAISEHQVPTSMSILTEHVKMSSTASPPRFETSVSLILLSCYVTLLRIAIVVLGHFQDYLLANPGARPRAPSISAAQNSVVYLGDVVPSHQLHDRIHTAIYMLFDSLEEVEEALCLPPQVRHASVLQASNDPASSLSELRDPEPGLSQEGLFSTTGGIRDILSELGRKVKETKEMLRYSMDL
ncbi:Nn.00g074800.m01.CDS01 [Neocucurbitaria sp. VM-36]